MNSDKVTFVINGNTYSISAGDPKAISSISSPDKKALLTLLESLKQQQEATEQRANQRLAQAAMASSSVGSSANKPSAAALSDKPQKAERLGRGDADALMARLIMEEKAKQKNIPNQGRFYKWILGISAIIIICTFVF